MYRRHPSLEKKSGGAPRCQTPPKDFAITEMYRIARHLSGPARAFEYSGIRGLFIQEYGISVLHYGYLVSCFSKFLIFGIYARGFEDFSIYKCMLTQ